MAWSTKVGKTKEKSSYGAESWGKGDTKPASSAGSGGYPGGGSTKEGFYAFGQEAHMASPENPVVDTRSQFEKSLGSNNAPSTIGGATLQGLTNMQNQGVQGQDTGWLKTVLDWARDTTQAQMSLGRDVVGRDLYATTGLTVPGYTPDQNVQYTAPIVVPNPSTIMNSLKGVVGTVFRKNAAREALTIGKEIPVNKLAGVRGVESSIATNAETTRLTAQWFEKLITQMKNPKLVAGVLAGAAASGLVASIGSYPFAGFIKEEALQTLGFATRSAIEMDDVQGAEESLALQAEILDPGLWDQIVAKVPYANVVGQLQEFYKAARIKMEVDKRVVEDMKRKLAGETEEQKWARIDEERRTQKEQERLDEEAYYAMVRQRQQEAKAADRKADEAYWSKIYADRENQKKKRDEMQQEYWVKYYQYYITNYYSYGGGGESNFSNLKFGLL